MSNAKETDGLKSLIKRNSTVMKDGFCVRFDRDTDAWDHCRCLLGRKLFYNTIAEELCRRYQNLYRKQFLFSEKCVSFELRYHVEAYLWAIGRSHCLRHVSTLLFTREALISHCRSVEIDINDTENLKQRVMFRYRSGIRACYRKTDMDPFRRFL